MQSHRLLTTPLKGIMVSSVFQITDDKMSQNGEENPEDYSRILVVTCERRPSQIDYLKHILRLDGLTWAADLNPTLSRAGEKVL